MKINRDYSMWRRATRQLYKESIIWGGTAVGSLALLAYMGALNELAAVGYSSAAARTGIFFIEHVYTNVMAYIHNQRVEAIRAGDNDGGKLTVFNPRREP